MGDAADYLNDSGENYYAAHLRGECEGPCPYCGVPKPPKAANPLAAFDDDFAAGPPPLPERPALPNGVYTLTLPDGGHRTFRVWTRRPGAKFKPGERLIGMLIGPDNTNDYEPFGEVTERCIKVWKRFLPHAQHRYAAIVWALGADGDWMPETPADLAGYDLQVSKRCMRCNNELTTPESLERGYGPECWEKLHG